MIFSTEADDRASVEVLTVFVVLITVVMMVWLVFQLLRECWHEKGTSVADLKEKVVVLRRRISSFSPERARGEEKNEEKDDDGDDGDHGTEGTTIEMRNWSMPNNPVYSL